MDGFLSQQMYEVAGFLGVAVYLGSYAALQLGYIRGAGYLYALLNLIAASLVLLSLASNFNLWSAIIQLSWITISVFGITRYFILTHRIRFTAEERALYEGALADMPYLDVRQLLDAGYWCNRADGAEIATHGEEIGALYYLAEGMVEIRSGDVVIRELGGPNFIGELTCFTGEPASATVRAVGVIRLFAIDTGVLQDLCRKNPDIRIKLESSLARDTRNKLIEATKQLSAG